MAFVYRSERKLGSNQVTTGDAVGPGAYIDSNLDINRKTVVTM